MRDLFVEIMCCLVWCHMVFMTSKSVLLVSEVNVIPIAFSTLASPTYQSHLGFGMLVNFWHKTLEVFETHR